jgi:hypothetical protein
MPAGKPNLKGIARRRPRSPPSWNHIGHLGRSGPRSSAFAAAMSRPGPSFASSKRMPVFGFDDNSLSMPAWPQPIERLMTAIDLA